MAKTAFNILNRGLSANLLLTFILLWLTVLFVLLKIRTYINTTRYSKLLYLLGSSLVFLTFTTFAIIYLLNKTFLDHIEPSVASISWLIHQNELIYPPVNAPEKYVLMYGPMNYIINWVSMELFNPSIFSAKLPGIIAGLLSLLTTYFTYKRLNVKRTLIFVYMGYMVASSLFFKHYVFWNRPDSFLLLCTTIGLLGATSKTRKKAILLVILSLGIAVNLKPHAVLYFLPLLILLCTRFSLSSSLAAIVGSLAIFTTPYFLPEISIVNYLRWLKVFSAHGFSLNILYGNVEFVSFILLPILSLGLFSMQQGKKIQNFYSENKSFINILIISITLLSIVASKPGAGSHHFIPFLPLLGFIFLSMVSKLKMSRFFLPGKRLLILAASCFLSIFLSTLLIGELRAVKGIYDTVSSNSQPIIQEVNSILDNNPDKTIGMGYGSNGTYRLTFVRPVLVFSGNPYVIDAGALMDSTLAGLEMSTSTYQVLKSCKVNLWLIPRGENPFEDFKYKDKALFPSKFLAIFDEYYYLAAKKEYFDVYSCEDP